MAAIRDLINDDQEIEPPSHHTFASNTHAESSPSSHSRSHSHGHHNHSHSHHHHSQHNHHFQPYPSHQHHGSNPHHPQEPYQQHYPPHPQGYPQEYYNQNHAPPPPHPGPQYYQPSSYSRDAPPRAFDPVKDEIAQHQQQPQLHQQPYQNHQHHDTNPRMPPDESSAIVRIKIVQQPLHARMCGFGEKDRRPVDPPPIVQLFFGEAMASLPPKVVTKRGSVGDRKRRRKLRAAKSKVVHNHARSNSHDADEESHNGEEEEDESYQLEDDDEDLPRSGAGAIKQEPGSEASSSIHKPENYERKAKPDGSPNDTEEDELDHNDDDDEEEDEQDPLFVLHVSLWSHDGTEVRNMIATPGQSDPPKLTRILMGSLVVSPILLNNPEGVPGWYFSFPDLSIRTEGVYTLKFSLMRFGSFDFLSSEEGQQASTLVAEETSDPFTVFSAKKFPGMTESTELSKAFAKQGLKIPIRNDLRVRKNADKD
ncbi:hypothetical protein BG003_009996 [Podila horticola]|nr:hypothetical protein BG003_009996 [Podila horticola]